MSGLITFTAIGMSAIDRRQEDEWPYKNLQILSKKTTEEEMERIMATFNRALGVTCAYCHYTTRDETSYASVDFASDDKKEKIIARKMMKMSIALNKKYFNIKVDKHFISNPVLWCRTCHRGYPVPKRFQ